MSYIPILSYSYIINNKNTLCRFAAHERGRLSAVVLYPCTAVGRAGISHIKDTIRMALDISRLARLSHQQTKYPPRFFNREERSRVGVSLFSFTHTLSLHNADTCNLWNAMQEICSWNALLFDYPPPSSATPKRGPKGGFVLRCISYMSYSKYTTDICLNSDAPKQRHVSYQLPPPIDSLPW